MAGGKDDIHHVRPMQRRRGGRNVTSDKFAVWLYRVCSMRITLILTSVFLLLAGAAPVRADDSRSTASAFMKCARIANDAQRLSCYDRLATELIELGLSSMGPTGGAASPAPSSAAQQPQESPAADAPSAKTAEAAPSSGDDLPAASGGGAAAVASSEQGFGLERVEEAQDKDVKKIQSRYKGEFTGWDGKTVFPLENGQVWQQIESGRMAWKATNPMITIKRGFMGSYMLSVEGVNKTVRVKRIE